MKKALIISIILSLVLSIPALAGGTRTCSVSPNPVPLGSAFTVSASGLTPNQTYNLNITQAKDPSNNAHPNWTIEIGSDGSGTSTVPSTSWSPDGILTVGDAKVRVYPQTNDARGTVNCAFKIVP